MKDFTPKKPNLEHSMPLNVHLWTDYPEATNAANAIYDELRRDAALKGREALKKKHIKLVVLNLWVNWLKDESLFTAYSRDRTYYFKSRRYRALYISPATIEVVDALTRLGYIENHPGYFNKAFREGRQSRMRATAKLITLITTAYRIPPETIHSEPDTECVILRNRHGWDVKYEDTAETRRMRAVLEAYNNCLAFADIAPPPDTKVDSKDRFIRRIFNNGTWDDGGRFYGGWWQGMPWEKRVQIAIDGSENGSVELDYSGHHIALLYAQQGIDYWGSGVGDPYKIKGFEQTDRMRSLLKRVLLIAINARNRRSAIGAVRSKIADLPSEYGWTRAAGIKLGKLIDGFAEHHSPIRDGFYSGAGIRLQRLDSDIAETIINHFTRQKVPLLCIHDSFVIHPAREHELADVMGQALAQATQANGFQIGIKPSLNRKSVDNLALNPPPKPDEPWVRLPPAMLDHAAIGVPARG